MKCKQCGKELKQGAKFCVNCGARVDDVDLGQTVTVAPVEPAADPDATMTVDPDTTVAVDPDMTMTVEHREPVVDSDATTVVEPVGEPMGDVADEAASEPVDDGADDSVDDPVDMSAAFEPSSEAATVLPDDPFTVAPTQKTVAMPKASAPVSHSDADGAGSAPSDLKSPKSRRAAIVRS